MLLDRERDLQRRHDDVVTLQVPLFPRRRDPVADFNTILGRNAKVWLRLRTC